MVALAVIWAVRLIFVGIFASCLLYLSSDTPPHHIVGHQIPWLESTRHVQVQDYHNETQPFRVFKSSHLRPPQLNFTTNGGELSDGYLFFTPKRRRPGGVVVESTIIMSQESELVYAFESWAGRSNLRPQTINGEPYLTAWHGHSKVGHGYGELIMMDSNYTKRYMGFNEVRRDINMNFPKSWPRDKIPPGIIDFHEQEVTERGTVIISAYNSTRGDLTAIGGKKDGWIIDSLFYEAEIATGQVIYSWSALEHFNVTDSKLPLPSYLGDGSKDRPYDMFHLNSVQAVGEDAFLISGRHMWAVYLISRKTGDVIWTLKGEGSGGSFGPLPAEARFRWQHHARAFNVSDTEMTISLFDNHNTDEDRDKNPSKALLLRVTLPPDKRTSPTVLRNIRGRDKLYALSQGSYQIGLSNGNQLVSYGPVPVIQEFGPGSDSYDLRWEGRFGLNDWVQSYRVFKAPWHGTPLDTTPSLVLEAEPPLLKGYVSWNGATDVEAWHVYHVEPGVALTPLGQALPRGFETKIEIPSRFNQTRCILVAAVQGGKEIRQSNRACISEEL